MAELLPAKRNERIEITLARYHFVRDDGGKEQDNPCNISPYLKQCRQDEIDEPEKLDGIAKFVAGVGVVCDGDKRHVQHDFCIEPAALDRKFAKYQRRHDTQGRGQHVGRVDRRKPQAVDGEL